jgi:hypothetical protein
MMDSSAIRATGFAEGRRQRVEPWEARVATGRSRVVVTASPFTGAADQLCLLIFTTVAARGGPGIGDQNACVELCDVDADCENPTAPCEPFEFGQYAQRTGRKGMCGVALDIGISPPE